MRLMEVRAAPATLEVLSDVLLILIPLLLPELIDFVLQLDDGPLDLVVLADQRHPAVEGQIQMFLEKEIQPAYSLHRALQLCELFKKHTWTRALAVWLLLPTDHSYAASSYPEFASCGPKKHFKTCKMGIKGVLFYF